MTTTVQDVMTRRVISVREDASFKEMADMLRRSRISAFPVIDSDNRVIGVVSEADLLVKEAVQATGTSIIAALRHVREDDKAKGVTAADLMTRPAITIGPGTSVAQAARVMYDRRVKRLPVVDAAGHLLGIIGRADVLAVFSRPDEEIRDEIVHRVLPAAVTGKSADFEVTVRDGIVTISGLPQSEQAIRALLDGARHVQGVVAVRDRFS
ncbi:MAG TPA: CBS domain-containing protein [Streptosporangiaceae bacterium]|nr:CBS domain-containing protein [Streptosporangiaceae bacterium]